MGAIASYLPDLPDCLHSSDLYTEPSFIKGIARTFDLFGWLDEYNYRPTGKEADEAALKRDWRMIGMDILHAIQFYDKITPSEK